MAAAQKKKRKSPSKKATWRGADVVRGEGMSGDDLERFLERNAMDQFDAAKEMWIVIEDNALQDLDDTVSVRGFSTRDEALRCAKAQSHGTVDHRVLRVTDQVLVVATMNDL